MILACELKEFLPQKCGRARVDIPVGGHEAVESEK